MSGSASRDLPRVLCRSCSPFGAKQKSRKSSSREWPTRRGCHANRHSHLAGFRDSQPVRIGNGAAFHQQFDIYGELLDAIYLYNKYGKPVTWEQWVAVREILGQDAFAFPAPRLTKFQTTFSPSGRTPTCRSGKFAAASKITPTRK